jgi:hypothetical protein
MFFYHIYLPTIMASSAGSPIEYVVVAAQPYPCAKGQNRQFLLVERKHFVVLLLGQ